MLHFTQVTHAAQRALCDLVKGSFTTSLCVLFTPAFQTSASKVFSSSLGALGPSWRLGLLHGLVDVGRQASGVVCSNDLTAGLEVPRSTRVPQPRRLGADADVALATALDRRVVGRARDGVVILGRGATVLRYQVLAMSVASCHLGSFRLVSLVLLVSYPSLSGARVYCGYCPGPTRVMTHSGRVVSHQGASSCCGLWWCMFVISCSFCDCFFICSFVFASRVSLLYSVLSSPSLCRAALFKNDDIFTLSSEKKFGKWFQGRKDRHDKKM